MDDTLRELLIDYLDGSLPPGQRDEVQQLIADDSRAARFVAEHQWVWEALDEVFGEVDVQPSAGFREQVVSRVRVAAGPSVRSWSLRRALALAACLALGLSAFSWWLDEHQSGPGLASEDQDVVRYLHVLREFELVESMSAELDLRAEYDVMRAFEGELEG